MIVIQQSLIGLPFDHLSINNVLIITDASFPDGLGIIRNQVFQIDLLLETQTVAVRAGTQR